jgi:hypothetical protein
MNQPVTVTGSRGRRAGAQWQPDSELPGRSSRLGCQTDATYRAAGVTGRGLDGS